MNDSKSTSLSNSILILAEHKQMVRELVKSPQKLHEESTPDKWSLLHPAIGIAGEVAEIMHATDRDNLIEEAGDLLFYIADMRDAAGIGEFMEFDTAEPMDLWSGRLLDVVKKVTIYNRPFGDDTQDKISNAVDAIENHLLVMLDSVGSSWEEAIAHNLAKLKTGPNARYAAGYSDEAAALRADKGGSDE